MNCNIEFPNKDKAIEWFGADFIAKVDGLMESLITKWAIDGLKLIDSFSANLVFKGQSEIYGPVVMKFGRNRSEFVSEVKALEFLSGKSICKLIDMDDENLVLLQESVDPGTELASEEKMDKRLDVFSDLFQQLHHDKKKVIDLSEANYKYDSYELWIFRITEYMEVKKGWDELTDHMKKAKDLYIQLSELYPTKSLLHGDFHYHNILKGEKGYKIIDPKGVIGNPIFDIPRYILNEYWDEKDEKKVDETLQKVFNVLSSKLNVPLDILTKLVYVEGCMANCWCVESGMTLDEKDEALQSLERLRRYIQ